MTLIRWIFFSWCALICTSAGAAAATDTAAGPQAELRETTERILDRLRENPALRDDQGALVQLIEREIFPWVDFPYTARLILARHWQSADEAQRQRFIAALQDVLACTYSAAFASYSGQGVDYLPPQWSADGTEVEIRIRITQTGKPPIPVGYRLRRLEDDWKLYDLLVDGVSLVTNYRSTFAAQLRQQNLDSLIDSMTERSGKDCRVND